MQANLYEACQLLVLRQTIDEWPKAQTLRYALHNKPSPLVCFVE